jgi:3-dehydroquinate synthase
VQADSLRLEVSVGSGVAYPVLVGSGILDRIGDLLLRHAPAHSYVIISDATVAALHGERLLSMLAAAGADARMLTFPAGERQKTRAEWMRLSDEMLAARLGRDTAILALGGGVTGDLAGFVAATYMRGLPLVQIPTSLLAMVDSSVGGKTGVDTDAGKNLIGAFHAPVLVAADIDLLKTLPAEHLRAGLAEAVKHGAITDAGYLTDIESAASSLLSGDPESLTRVVGRSVQIKADIVSRDPREGGLRKVLNFGHTLGHALETLSGYELLHGEAISIGMVLEARLGEAMGITRVGSADRLATLLDALGLPVRPSRSHSPDEVIAATMLDKKGREGRVEYALISEIGRAAPPLTPAVDQVRKTLIAEGTGFW